MDRNQIQPLKSRFHKDALPDFLPDRGAYVQLNRSRMKKVFLLAVVFVSLAMIIVAADFRRIPDLLQSKPIQKTCVGYTIIEFDKGIDCYGDTVKLVRKYGFAELATVIGH